MKKLPAPLPEQFAYWAWLAGEDQLLLLAHCYEKTRDLFSAIEVATEWCDCSQLLEMIANRVETMTTASAAAPLITTS